MNLFSEKRDLLMLGTGYSGGGGSLRLFWLVTGIFYDIAEILTSVRLCPRKAKKCFTYLYLVECSKLKNWKRRASKYSTSHDATRCPRTLVQRPVGNVKRWCQFVGPCPLLVLALVLDSEISRRPTHKLCPYYRPSEMRLLYFSTVGFFLFFSFSRLPD